MRVEASAAECEVDHYAVVTPRRRVIHNTCDGAHSQSQFVLRNFGHIDRRTPGLSIAS